MGGVNSQVLLNQTEIEAAVEDLRGLLGPFQVRTDRFCPAHKQVLAPGWACPLRRPDWIFPPLAACSGIC